MTQDFIHISPDALRIFTGEIFKRLGLSSKDASLASDCLVKANLRGVDSHGVSRIPIYAKRLPLKLLDPRRIFRRLGWRLPSRSWTATTVWA